MPRSFTLQRRHSVPRKLVRLGSWKGVRDVGDSDAQSPEYLQDCINGLFLSADSNGAIYARPGFDQDTSSQLGSGSNRQVQCIINAPTTGTIFAICGGVVYRRSPGVAWTDVSPVGITINTSGPINACLYNGEIIFNDGTNEPWRASALTSTPITGTEIEINTAGSAWVARGAPTVHGGKLFFIVDSAGGTARRVNIVWSEEGDAGVGYEQDGYTNTWDLIQTSDAFVTAICGSEAGLYYARVNSIGLIQGAVNADFQTNSTHDAIPSLGSNSPRIFTVIKGYLWFLSYEGMLHRVPLGGTTPEPIWKQLFHRIKKTSTLTTSFTSNAQRGSIAYLPDMNKVVVGGWLMEETGFPEVSRNLYVFDADTASYEGRWIVGLASQPATETPSVAQIRCIAAAFDAEAGDTSGRQVLWAGGTLQDGTEGHIWRQYYLTNGTVGDDDAAMHFSITPMLAPNDQTTEFRVDEIAVDAVPDSATLSLDYYTPRATTTGLSLTGITGGDSIQSSFDHGRYVAGLNALGRWFRPVLHWNVPSGSTPYAFERAVLKVRGFPASPRAK